MTPNKICCSLTNTVTKFNKYLGRIEITNKLLALKSVLISTAKIVP